MIKTFKICSPSCFQIYNPVLLTIVTVLYIVSPWLTHFITGNLCCLNPFTHLHPPQTCPHRPQATTDLFSVSMSSVLFVCVFQIPDVSEIIQCLSSSVWHISLSIIPSRSIHVADDKISFFLRLDNIRVCVCVTFSLFFIHRWTFRLFPCLGYCKCCSEPGGAYIFFELVFSFSLDEYPKVELLDHMLVLFLIFRGTSILFSVVAAPFTFPPTVHKGSFFSISSPTFVIPSLFDNRYSNRCEVISHCVFYLYFPDYQWCWATLRVPVGHL